MTMRPFILLTAIALALTAHTAAQAQNDQAAQNLMPYGDAEHPKAAALWQRGPHAIADPDKVDAEAGVVQRHTSDPHNGEAAFAFGARHWIYAPTMIEIDPSKTYKLSGYFKTVEGTEQRTLFSIWQYDENKQRIDLHAVRTVPDTQTELAADVEAGDTTVTINATNWKIGPLHSIAFHVEEDLSDLPNNDTLRIEKFNVGDDRTIVTLSEPAEKPYSAGTAVRQHRYVDPESIQVPANGEWQEFSFTIGGQSAPGEAKQEQFWHDTQYVRIALLPNFKHRNEQDYVTFLFDDLSFTEVPETE